MAITLPTPGDPATSGNWGLTLNTAINAIATQLPYNVTSFGAVGDNSTDNTTQIQAAITAMPTTGGVLYFPAGIYRTTGSLTIPSATRNVIIKGDGGRTSGSLGASVINMTSATGRLFDCRSTQGVQFRDLTLFSNNVLFDGTFIDFSLLTVDGSYHNVSNLLILSTASTTGRSVGIDLTKSNGIKIEDTHFMNIGFGIRGRTIAADYSNAISINNCLFHTDGILNPGQAWIISDCVFEGAPSNIARAVDHDAGVTFQGLSIRGCWSGDTTSGVQYNLAGSGLVFQGNWIGSTGGVGLQFDAGSSGLSITGNYFHGGTHGLRLLTYCHDYQVEFNYFDAYSVAAVDQQGADVRYRIQNNQCGTMTGAGVDYSASTDTGDHSGV